MIYPVDSVIQRLNNLGLVIKQMELPLRGRPIFLITRMITDRIGLHYVYWIANGPLDIAWP